MKVHVGNKTWKCSRCGNMVTVDNPPRVCPVCEGLNSYYETPEATPEELSEEVTGEEGVIK